MTRLRNLLALSLLALVSFIPRLAQAQDAAAEDNQCLACHGNRDVWEGETLHLFVDAASLAGDVHWQKGLRCVDCHGGNSKTFELRQAHAIEDGFRKLDSPQQVPDFCGHCHADAKYMQRFDREAKTDQVQRFWSSVHGQYLKQQGSAADVPTCISCHPKHATRPANDPDSAISAQKLPETCGACHRTELVELRKGVHSWAGEKDERGAGTLLDCGKCHGADSHGLMPVKNFTSPVFLDNQVRTCGNCHGDKLKTYQESVHGRGLSESGLVLTAVCADCHGAHGIFYAPDKRSRLNVANVAKTCGQCHRFIEEKLAKSIHGPGQVAPQDGSHLTLAKPARKPTCIDCHQGHDHFEPTSLAYRQQLPNRCGNCHAEIAQRYRMSLHGELTQLGYEPAAKCSDCHGAHDVLLPADPKSHLAGANRIATCRHCHPGVNARFAEFDPHASPKDAQNYPRLHAIHVAIGYGLNVLIAIFVIHTVVWFSRSLVQTLQHGRHKRLATSEMAVIRFQPYVRTMYVLLLVCFLGLALTGVPLKFSHQPWARSMANALGGFDTTRVWHHFFGLTVLILGAVQVVWGLRRIRLRRREGRPWGQVLFGPDSLLPNARDARDFYGMLRWFIGLGRKPRFERWTYWEKFDFWIPLLVGVVIGFSGLALWFPGVFSGLFSGRVLNVAKMLHSEVPLAVGGVLFIIHVFNTHLRPEKFPLDLSLFTGLVSEEHLLTARPEFLDRLRREGKLAEIRTPVPEERWLKRIAWAGVFILMVGLLLLAGILIANLGE